MAGAPNLPDPFRRGRTGIEDEAMVHGTPGKRSPIRLVFSILLILMAVIILLEGWTHRTVVREFVNPIAYTMMGNSLYVLEKKNNTLLRLELVSPSDPLILREKMRIETDDADHYYMARKIYPGPHGIVVQSYVYLRESRQFLGYRFREYRDSKESPQDILLLALKNPGAYPEVRYAFDKDGFHYFANNCTGRCSVWKIHPEGRVVMDETRAPPEVVELGRVNEPLSNWSSIYVREDGNILVSSGTSGQIIQYEPDGRPVRVIGKVGFEEGELLAPRDIFTVQTGVKETPSQSGFMVACAGNRCWIEFDDSGRVLRTIYPIEKGYPFQDTLVGRIFFHEAMGVHWSFDTVNRSLVLHGSPYRIITAYREDRPGHTVILTGLSLLCLVPLLGYSRLISLAARLRFTFFFRILLLFVPLLAAGMLVVGEWVRDIMNEQIAAESVRRSANLSQAVLNTLRLQDLQSIQRPEDRESPVYEKIYSTVNCLIDSRHVEHTPKWILHKIHDGRYYFGINIWRGPVFEPFIVPPDRKMFFDVLSEKKPVFGRFRDDQGEWFSYLNPVLDPEGKAVYVLELYRPTEEMDRADDKAEERVFHIVGVTLFIAVLVTLLSSFFFTRPLRRLMQGIRAVSSGDFGGQISVRSRDEFGTLAQAFNQMQVDLKQYTEELTRTTAENERIQVEMRLARDVQQGILPKEFPPYPSASSIEIHAHMEPAREVGGDYFDFFMIDTHHMGIVVADVSGKGVSAGLFMMVVRALLRNNAAGNLSPAEAVTRMNMQLAFDNPSTTFVTMFYLVCNLETGEITFCNAGHNPPIWLKKNGIQVLASEEGRGTVVGVIEDAVYTDGRLILAEGESLVIFTDGVTESINDRDEMFGDEGLIHAIEDTRHLSSKAMCDEIVHRLSLHQGKLEQFDDITLLFLKFLGTDGNLP